MTDCPQSISYLETPEFMILACHCLAGIQLPVFLFGAFCIIFKTSPQMANVKWLLLNTQFWSSLSDFIISYLGIPYLFIPALAGYGLGLVNSPALAIYSLVTAMALSGVSIIAIYENRYFMLFGQKTWWRRYRRPYFVMIYILTPFIFVPPYFHLPEQESARKQVLSSIPCLPNFAIDDRKMFVLSLDFTVMIICVGCALLILVASFLTFLSLTFWKIWMEDAWSGSRHTMALQKSFTKGVTIQTIYEFVILFIPVVTLLSMIIFWWHNQTLINIAFLILSLNGVGSTIIMIFVHKPYRTFTSSVFCICCSKIKIKDRTQWRTQLSALS